MINILLTIVNVKWPLSGTNFAHFENGCVIMNHKDHEEQKRNLKNANTIII